MEHTPKDSKRSIPPPRLDPSPDDSSVRERLLRPLTESEMDALAFVAAVYERMRHHEGPAFHKAAVTCLHTGTPDGDDPAAWPTGIERRGEGASSAVRRHAVRLADRWRRQGIWGLTWREGKAPAGFEGCGPAVFFGIGPWPGATQRMAVFNSRKSRQIDPEAEWLQDLREVLSDSASRGFGLAASRGTLTYDLVAAYAAAASLPLLFVMAEPIERLFMDQPHLSALESRMSSSTTMLSCRCASVSCPKVTSLLCRDRLLALLADVYCVLQLRPGGNLERILDESRRLAPRPRWILPPHRPKEKGEIAQTRLFLPSPASQPALSIPHIVSIRSVDWPAYLTHYTRSCPGPWPGETADDYLQSLLQGLPLSGHTALDTLIRIFCDGRLRAGARLTRGSDATISWTSRPPHDLPALKRWNRALGRWTAEPYGIAVNRGLLRRLGTKPSIYADAACYERLKPRDRFRFQKHEPPRCLWKHEREWRLRGDLLLEGISPAEALVVVPDEEAARRLLDFTDCPFPLVLLNEV